MQTLQALIEHLQKTGVLKSEAILNALRTADRADFLPKELKAVAYEDTALPIGSSQTISQPHTVVFMLEQLQVQDGDRVLEIGYGSGWQTTLLAHLVGPTGHVYAFEIVPSLCKYGKHNIEKYPDLARRVRLFCQSGKQGLADEAPFHRIIAAAEVHDVPDAWREQLKIMGRMIYPKNNALVVEVKKSDAVFEAETFPGFVFVPLI